MSVTQYFTSNKNSTVQIQVALSHCEKVGTYVKMKLDQFSISVVMTLCNPMDCSTPGFLVHQQLPELIQTHVHRVGDAIQPSHPLLPHFSFYLQSFLASGSYPMSQLFTSGGHSIRTSASVLPMNIQGGFPLGLLIGLISLSYMSCS